MTSVAVPPARSQSPAVPVAPDATVTVSVFVTVTETDFPVSSSILLTFCASRNSFATVPSSSPASQPVAANVYVLPASATLAESLAGFAADAVSVTDASAGSPFVRADPSSARTP